MGPIPIPKGKPQVRDVQELKAAFAKAQEHYDGQTKPLLSIIGMLRSIEIDLKARGVVTAFTMEVYECHVRLALEEGSVRDFAVTMLELEKMYESEGTTDELEMVAYNLFYFILFDMREDVGKRLERGTFINRCDPCFEYAKAFARSWLDGKPIEVLLRDAKLTEPPGHLSYVLSWFTDETVLNLVSETKKREENKKIGQAMHRKGKKNSENSESDSYSPTEKTWGRPKSKNSLGNQAVAQGMFLRKKPDADEFVEIPSGAKRQWNQDNSWENKGPVKGRDGARAWVPAINSSSAASETNTPGYSYGGPSDSYGQHSYKRKRSEPKSDYDDYDRDLRSSNFYDRPSSHQTNHRFGRSDYYDTRNMPHPSYSESGSSNKASDGHSSHCQLWDRR